LKTLKDGAANLAACASKRAASSKELDNPEKNDSNSALTRLSNEGTQFTPGQGETQSDPRVRLPCPLFTRIQHLVLKDFVHA
jgi:hypothetical protein